MSKKEKQIKGAEQMIRKLVISLLIILVGLTSCIEIAELTVSDDGNGDTSPSGRVPVALNQPFEVDAAPAPGYVFDEWVVINGDVLLDDATAMTTSVTVAGGPAEVMATFAPESAQVQDGTLTIRVVGASDHNGQMIFFAAFAEGGPMVPDEALGTASTMIVDGIAEAAFVDAVTYSSDVVLEGGKTYWVGGFIDANPSDTYDPGDFSVNRILEVYVDGDTVVEVTYPTDFILVE